MSGPLTAAQFDALNGTKASYGPPSNAHFTEPGPITVAGGASSSLFTGPSASAADTILLVLSATGPLSGSVASLTFAGQTVVFSASDFFTTTAAGFPSNIGGIANGQVNGIAFPTAVHAGVDIDFGAPLTSFGGTDSLIGNVQIASTANLRVDVFGDSGGLIVGSASNSGAEGVTAGGVVNNPPAPVPEPASMALLGAGLLGFSVLRRHARA